MLYHLSVFALLVVHLNADLYLHNPRGSNNRLNEASANRDNANRMFDSQNNNRGGHNVGDLDPTNGFQEGNWLPEATEQYNFNFYYEDDGVNTQTQYEMLYFEESYLSATWTNQHGTGNQKLNTMMVLQFICDTFPRATTAGGDGLGPTAAITSADFGSGDQVSLDTATMMRKHGLRVELYNGGNTNTPDEPDSIQDDPDGSDIVQTYQNNNDNNRGRREAEEYYSLCKSRWQQYGLFHADQDLDGDSQIYTRQNPGGTRRGLECPEERDYYPWWNPSPFHDIAILTPDVDYCKDYIAPESQNVQEKYQCVRDDVEPTDNIANWLPDPDAVIYNLNETYCREMSDHTWEGFKWNGEEPKCVDSYWTKVNYLGNVDGSKRGGKMAHYDWQLPSYESLTSDHYCYPYTYTIAQSGDSNEDYTVDINCVRMMFRIRYNMSTMDYDPYKTDSSYDEDDDEEIVSPIENNPTVDVGVYAQGLQLAINTAQTGRVFQDNTHTFLVCERPSEADWKGRTMYNVNVRGKRGNIVQTFPAVEYDFEPQDIFIKPNECMHFQWTGSNTHNNGAPGGDGQTGDDGEGRGGSDRSTLVQSKAMDESYPLTYDKFDDNFFTQVDCYHPLQANIDVDEEDAQLILGSAGFYKGVQYAMDQLNSIGEDAILDVLLNNASASFRAGLICCIKGGADQGEYSFISTRNNNFTNRSQKLKITITNDPEDMTQW